VKLLKKKWFRVLTIILVGVVLPATLFMFSFFGVGIAVKSNKDMVSILPFSPTIVLAETKEVSTVQVVIKEVLIVQPLRDFTSYEELKLWLEVNGGIVLVADDNGIISLTTISEQNDCDDQARRLQEKAEKDGYRLSVQIVDTGYLCSVKVSPPAHMGNLAIIGNLVYFVDVTQGNMIIKVCELDGGDI